MLALEQFVNSLPKECSKSVSICNQNVACPNNTVYNKCQVPHLKNATLTCNDTLQWEPSFQCPKDKIRTTSLFTGNRNSFPLPYEEQVCPYNVSVCGKNIQPNQTAVGTEFEVLIYGNPIHFKCQDDCKWGYNYQCPNGAEVRRSNREIFLGVLLPLPVLFLLSLLLIKYYLISHRKKGVRSVLCHSFCKSEDAAGVTSKEQAESNALKPLSISQINFISNGDTTELLCSTNNEITCEEEEQLSDIDGTTNEDDRSSTRDSGYNEATDQDDVQEKNCGNEASDVKGKSTDNMSIHREDQPSETLELDSSPPEESGSSAGDNEDAHQNDAQKEGCGNETLDAEEKEPFLDKTTKIKNGNIHNSDENLPTDISSPKKFSITKEKLMKSLSTSVLLWTDSLKFQNSLSLRSLPDKIDEQACHLPIQEHGSTAVSVYDINCNSERPKDLHYIKLDSVSLV